MRMLAMVWLVLLGSCGAVTLATHASAVRSQGGGGAFEVCGIEHPCTGGGGSAGTLRVLGVLGVATIVSVTAAIAKLRR